MNELPEGTRIYPMLTVQEFNTGNQTRDIWYKNKNTDWIEYIGPLNKLAPGYENLKTADDRVLQYEDNTFFSVLDDPYNMRRSVRGGRKNKSKKYKSKKYKSKKYKSKKYK